MVYLPDLNINLQADFYFFFSAEKLKGRREKQSKNNTWDRFYNLSYTQGIDSENKELELAKFRNYYK